MVDSVPANLGGIMDQGAQAMKYHESPYRRVEPFWQRTGHLGPQEAVKSRTLARWFFAASCLITACSNADNRWKAVVYPTGSDLDDQGLLPFVEIGDFSDLDTCSTAALQYIATNGSVPKTASYECGRRCREAEYGQGGVLYTYVCAEKAGPMARFASALRSASHWR